MSEVTTPPSPDAAEVSDAVRTVKLHNETLQLQEGKVLHALDDTRTQFGINGTMLAEVVLPTDLASNDTVDKRLGVIDYGESIPPEGKAILFFPDSGKELTSIGVTHTRYALVGTNYHPSDLLAAFLPLKPGSSQTIGRSKDNRNNYVLGLSEDGHPDLSRDHATITVDEHGKITIEDHSTNGTEVVLPEDS